MASTLYTLIQITASICHDEFTIQLPNPLCILSRLHSKLPNYKLHQCHRWSGGRHSTHDINMLFINATIQDSKCLVADCLTTIFATFAAAGCLHMHFNHITMPFYIFMHSELFNALSGLFLCS